MECIVINYFYELELFLCIVMNYSYELECIAIQNEVCKTHSISVNSSCLIYYAPFSHYFVLLFFIRITTEAATGGVL